MKKKLLAAVVSCLTAVACCFGSCSWLSYFAKKYYRGDDVLAKEHTAKLLEAMENKDKTALKAMFAPNSIAAAENFDESIEQLFEYFQGTGSLYEDHGPWCSESVNHGDRIRVLHCHYDIETSEDAYRIFYDDTVIDTTDSDNIGINTFYIIRAEDDIDLDYAYWGDGKDTPGINIGLQSSDGLTELKHLLRKIKTRDTQRLKESFSDEAISGLEGFDESIEALYEYYKDEMIDFNRTDIVYEKTSGGDITMNVSYDIVTDKQQNYRIAFRWVSFVGTDNVGIISLYIIKAEDDTDLSVPYWGDGLFTLGIHIGIPNAVSASE